MPRRRRARRPRACCSAGGGGAREIAALRVEARATATRFFSDLDGLEYDNLFIFDEVGWNFEPSEISGAFGLVQLRKLAANLARRKRNFALLSELFGTSPDVFVLPRLTPGVDTGWHMFPILIRPESGVRRAEFQQHMERHGVDTRMVWTGNATRQPAFAEDRRTASPPGGLPERRPGDGAGPHPAVEPRRSTTTTSRTSARRPRPSSRAAERPSDPRNPLPVE